MNRCIAALLLATTLASAQIAPKKPCHCHGQNIPADSVEPEYQNVHGSTLTEPFCPIDSYELKWYVVTANAKEPTYIGGGYYYTGEQYETKLVFKPMCVLKDN
jgi:hypothetical protein